MNRVLVLYPELFNVKSKFFRKLNNILKNQIHFEIVYLNDFNGFIDEYCAENLECVGKKIQNLDQFDITHAIIFDDGEEFEQERNWVLAKNIPFRWIKILITRVINVDKEDYSKYGSQYEYIGRRLRREPNTPNWSNPYSMYDFQIDGDDEDLSREEVIRKFEYGFNHENLPTNLKKADTYQLAGKRLGCHCKPHACHGDVIAKFLNSWDDGK